MFLIRTKLAFIVILLASLSTVLCPFLKVTLMKSWNMYQVDTSLFYVTNGLLALLLLLTFFQKARLFRFVGFVFFLWCLLAVSAVYFQVNNFFGKKLVDGVLSKSIDFEWGWIVLFCMALGILLSVRKVKILN